MGDLWSQMDIVRFGGKHTKNPQPNPVPLVPRRVVVDSKFCNPCWVRGGTDVVDSGDVDPCGENTTELFVELMAATFLPRETVHHAGIVDDQRY